MYSHNEYHANCPQCAASVYCCDADLMGFPQMEGGDPDPLRTVCDECGAELIMDWQVTLLPAEGDDEEDTES